jgi:hypothetical protein
MRKKLVRRSTFSWGRTSALAALSLFPVGAHLASKRLQTERAMTNIDVDRGNGSGGQAPSPRENEDKREAFTRAIERGRGLLKTLGDRVTTRPYTAVGIAAGASFLLGMVFGRRPARMLGLLGAGYAIGHHADGFIGDVLKVAIDRLSKSPAA